MNSFKLKHFITFPTELITDTFVLLQTVVYTRDSYTYKTRHGKTDVVYHVYVKMLARDYTHANKSKHSNNYS